MDAHAHAHHRAHMCVWDTHTHTHTQDRKNFYIYIYMLLRVYNARVLKYYRYFIITLPSSSPSLSSRYFSVAVSLRLGKRRNIIMCIKRKKKKKKKQRMQIIWSINTVIAYISRTIDTYLSSLCTARLYSCCFRILLYRRRKYIINACYECVCVFSSQRNSRERLNIYDV